MVVVYCSVLYSIQSIKSKHQVEVDFKIYDSFGRLIQTGCGNTFDLKNYKNGVYMVSLEIKEQFKTFLVYKQ